MSMLLLTIIGIVLIILIELFRMRSENNEMSIKSVFQNGQFLSILQQILIIFISATLALYIAQRNDAKEKRERYINLLNAVYLQVYSEEKILEPIIDNDPTTMPQYDLLDNETLVDVIADVDCSNLINNVLNTSDAALELAPLNYSTMLYVMNERSNLWNKIYTNNYRNIGDINNAILLLHSTDLKLEWLILAQIDYLKGVSTDEELNNLYYDTFIKNYDN